MIGKKVTWYRNTSEKDQGDACGTGTLVHLDIPHFDEEAVAIIMEDDGNFRECTLSLIKAVLPKPVVTPSKSNLVKD